MRFIRVGGIQKSKKKLEKNFEYFQNLILEILRAKKMFWGFEDAFCYEDNCLIGSKKVKFSKVSVDKVFVATDFELF